MRLLLLTTPELRGPDVLTVQRQLAHHGFPPGELDGTYGPATAGAVRRFQRRCELTVDGIVGPATRGFLEQRELPPAKPHHPGREPAGSLALRWLGGRLGEKEHPPASNDCPITREFRLGRVPWCMEAVSLAFKHGANLILGDQLPHPWGFWDGRGFAYVPAFEAWAKSRGYWIGRTIPEHGDVAVYDFGTGRAEHVGIVEIAWRGRFHAIEGNTAVGNNSNGGEVMRRERFLDQVVGFARVGWTHP